MTAIDFPNSPQVNDTFTASGRTWKWTGTVWVTVASTTIAPTAHAASHGSAGADAVTVAQSQVTGLDTALSGKAATSHTHTTAQITMAVSDKSANYAILAADKNTLIRSTNAAITITIDNVLAVGESVNFVQWGAGQVTFAAGSGVTIGSVDAKLKTNKQYSGATVTCVASGLYSLVGDLAA